VLRFLTDLGTPASLRLMPKMPDAVKRALLGGRTVTVDGNTLDTTLQLMLTAQRLGRVAGLIGSDDITVARERLRTTAAAMHTGIPVGIDDLSIPGPAGPLRARHYQPPAGPDADAPPLLVFYHGGGFVVGDLDVHDDLCRLLCRDGRMQVLSIDYRRAPESPAPAAADDAYAAYRWASEEAGRLGADPHRVAVGGDSAGGNLAAVVSQRARNERAPLPALQLLLYPMTNMLADTRSRTLFADGYFLSGHNIEWCTYQTTNGASVDRRDPVVSPLLAEDLSGLPPALVVVAGFDPLRDEGIQYAEAMRAAGVTVELLEEPTVIHAFANFFSLGGDSATAMQRVISATRAHLNQG
jgi:acetyl esterase